MIVVLTICASVQAQVNAPESILRLNYGLIAKRLKHVCLHEEDYVQLIKIPLPRLPASNETREVRAETY